MTTNNNSSYRGSCQMEEGARFRLELEIGRKVVEERSWKKGRGRKVVEERSWKKGRGRKVVEERSWKKGRGRKVGRRYREIRREDDRLNEIESLNSYRSVLNSRPSGAFLLKYCRFRRRALTRIVTPHWYLPEPVPKIELSLGRPSARKRLTRMFWSLFKVSNSWARRIDIAQRHTR